MANCTDCSLDIRQGHSVDEWEFISGPGGGIKYGGVTVNTSIGNTWSGSGNQRGDNMDDVCFENVANGTYVFRGCSTSPGCPDACSDYTVVVYNGCSFVSGGSYTIPTSPFEYNTPGAKNIWTDLGISASAGCEEQFQDGYLNWDGSFGRVNQSPEIPGIWFNVGGNVGQDYNGNQILTLPSGAENNNITYYYLTRLRNPARPDCDECYSETVTNYFKFKQLCDYCIDLVDFDTKSNFIDTDAIANSANPQSRCQVVITDSCSGPNVYDGPLQIMYWPGGRIGQTVRLNTIGQRIDSFDMENSASGAINVDLSFTPEWNGSNGATIVGQIESALVSARQGSWAYYIDWFETSNLTITLWSLIVHNPSNYTGWDGRHGFNASQGSGGFPLPTTFDQRANNVTSIATYTRNGVTFNTPTFSHYITGASGIGPQGVTPCGGALVDTKNTNTSSFVAVDTVASNYDDLRIFTSRDPWEFDAATAGFGANPQCRNC